MFLLVIVQVLEEQTMEIEVKAMYIWVLKVGKIPEMDHGIHL